MQEWLGFLHGFSETMLILTKALVITVAHTKITKQQCLLFRLVWACQLCLCHFIFWLPHYLCLYKELD